jgi:uncharacterized protein (TIGR04222 family)
MNDFINIPGPIFLIVFTVYAFLVILFFRRYVNKDYSLKYELPEPTKLEPLDIAILKNGVKGAITISIFNLWRLKGADISKSENSIVLKQKPIDTSKFNKLEKTIYKYILRPKFYRQLYIKGSIKTIDKILQPNKTKLLELHLAPDSKVINRHLKGVLLGSFFLGAFGGIKLYFGIARGRPFGFLIILMILSIVALFIVIKPTKIKTSALGKKLLYKTQQRFAWLKSSTKGTELLLDDNLLYGIAVFGISSFLGSELGELLENPLLLERQSSSSIYGYGCGCAGCGGGCGGGGCGGGCGGCGGD